LCEKTCCEGWLGSTTAHPPGPHVPRVFCLWFCVVFCRICVDPYLGVCLERCFDPGRVVDHFVVVVAPLSTLRFCTSYHLILSFYYLRLCAGWVVGAGCVWTMCWFVPSSRPSPLLSSLLFVSLWLLEFLRIPIPIQNKMIEHAKGVRWAKTMSRQYRMRVLTI